MMLYSSVAQKSGDGFIRVGIVARNNNDEIMLINQNIDRINKSVLSIPFVDVKEFKEENIISELNNKYGIRINGLQSYINETNFLDDMCNQRLQINMTCKTENVNIDGAKWSMVGDILNDLEVPSNVKQCIEVYSYNQNIN